MLTFRTISVFLLLFAAIPSFTQVTFQKTYATDIAGEGYDLLETPDGYLILGNVNTTLDNVDAIMIKTDFYGNVIWQRSYGGFQYERLYSIVAAGDGGFIASGVSNSFSNISGNYDAWIIKVDANGEMLWQKTMGTTDFEESLYHPIITVSDGYIFSGNQSDPGYRRGIVLRTDFEGNTIWSSWNASANFNYTGVGFINNNKLYACGTIGYAAGYYTLDPATGSVLTVVKYETANDTIFATGDYEQLFDILPADAGNVIMSGTVSYENPGLNISDALVIKTNEAGEVIWSKTFTDGNVNYNFARMIKAHGSGYLINLPATSTSFDQDNARLFKMGEDGQIEWARLYGGDDHDSFYKLIATSDGGYLATGVTYSASGKSDIFLVKTNGDGLVDGCCTPAFSVQSRDYLLETNPATFTNSNFLPLTDLQFILQDSLLSVEQPFCGQLKEIAFDTVLFNPGETVVINGVTYDQPAFIQQTLPAINTDCDTTLFTILQFTPLWYLDTDGDGYGDDNITINALTAPDGYAPFGGDCDNNNAAISPGAPEICGNTIDDNCDGQTDEDTTAPVAVCVPSVTIELGLSGTAFVSAAAVDNGSSDNCSDPLLVLDKNQYFCADTGALPLLLIAFDDAGNFNFCQTILTVMDGDADGDGVGNCIDECPGNAGFSTTPAWYTDGDMDGFGTGGPVFSCVPPPGTSANADDCDDLNALVFPGATETANGLDDDCDGLIDEGTVGVSGAYSSGLVLFPNPAHDWVRVQWPDHVLLGELSWRLTTAAGSIVQAQTGIKTTGNTLEINVAKIPAGVYLLQVDGADKKGLFGKVVKW